MKDRIVNCKKCHTVYSFLSTGVELCTGCVQKFPYYISFVEEGFVGVTDKIFGRVEVYSNKDPKIYAIDELRFVFKNSPRKRKEFQAYRDTWEAKDIREQELEMVKKSLTEG